MRSNERIWITRDRREIRIKDMKDSHLINATNMIIERNFRLDYLEDMFEEILRRRLKFEIDVPLWDAIELDKIYKRAFREVKKEKTVKTNKPQVYTVLRRPKSYESPMDSDTSTSQESTLGATS